MFQAVLISTLLCLCFLYAQLGAATKRNILGLQITAQADGTYSIVEANEKMYSGDREQCYQERLNELYRRYGFGRLNIRWATLGGKQYWADQYIIDGWRIQQHIGTKHYRLLNPKDRRYAWGSYEACRTALEWQRYENGAGEKIETEAVVLLHGIVRSKDSMRSIQDAFEQRGCEVININYPSRKGEIADFAKQVNELLNKRTDLKRVSYVTHSMGGLVLRTLLADKQASWRQHATVHRAVMIFPPNQGAHKANEWHNKIWYRLAMGKAGRELCSDKAQALPLLDIDCGIIVGAQGNEKGKSNFIPGDDDGTVGVEECKLSGVTDYAYHPVGHTYGMNKQPVIDDVLNYIDLGKFK